MKLKVIIVMPAYNAATTLEKTVKDIPQGFADEIILVDDSSQDDTVRIAKSLGLRVFVHDRNRGYGANQKTCYDEALQRGAEIVVMIHPDYQYDGSLAPLFSEIIEKGVCDIILGSRVRTRKECLDSGMPLYKYISNRLLTIIENLITGQNLSEWHTGYRAYSRKVLETIPYHKNSNDFVFDSQFLIQAAYFGFKIGDLPVPCRYMSEASLINLNRSIVYGLGTIKTLFQFILQKLHLMKFVLFGS
ncbi:MAG: glycosyltransferase family 2 protein [Thermodesulfobacteriota bacterium]|jgi:glycosyltransferase involved in cell wall biosynthesis